MLYQLSHVRTTFCWEPPASGATTTIPSCTTRRKPSGTGAGSGTRRAARGPPNTQRPTVRGLPGVAAGRIPVARIATRGSSPGRCDEEPTAGLWLSLAGVWRSGSALRSHRRGHWFEPSYAHPERVAGTPTSDDAGVPVSALPDPGPSRRRLRMREGHDSLEADRASENDGRRRPPAGASGRWCPLRRASPPAMASSSGRASKTRSFPRRAGPPSSSRGTSRTRPCSGLS